MAHSWLNESVFDWTLPEHEIQLSHEGSGGGGHWDGSMPVRIHTFDGECSGYRSGNDLPVAARQIFFELRMPACRARGRRVRRARLLGKEGPPAG